MRGFCPLSSGSKGNVIYMGSQETKILVDAGISCKQIEKKLSEIGVKLEELDGILITHEHIDHIRGLEILSQKVNIPIFANHETAKAICSMVKRKPRFKIFSTGETFEFGDITIHPFSVQHDTMDPVAFTCDLENQKIGICTDLGFVTTLVQKHLEACHILYVESNHEPSMVHACNRSMRYKQRVLGRQGHLSNEMCATLIHSVYHKDLRCVYLAHLSQECNHPHLALKYTKEKLVDQNVVIHIAYQDEISTPSYWEHESIICDA